MTREVQLAPTVAAQARGARPRRLVVEDASRRHLAADAGGIPGTPPIGPIPGNRKCTGQTCRPAYRSIFRDHGSPATIEKGQRQGMNELLSFGLAAGLAALLLGSIGVWAWRRRVRSRRVEAVEARGDTATVDGIGITDTAEGIGPNEAESGGDAEDSGEASDGDAPNCAPTDGGKPAPLSRGEDDASVPLYEIPVPPSEPPPVDQVPSNGHAREYFANDGDLAPHAKIDVSIDEKSKVTPPVRDQHAMAAIEEEPAEEDASQGTGIDPTELLPSVEQPKTEQRHLPGKFIGTPATNSADQLDADEGRPSDANEHVPENLDQSAAPHTAADHTGPAQVPDTENPPDSANDQAGSLSPKSASIEPPSAKTKDGPTRRPRRPARHRDRRGGRRGAAHASKPPEIQPTSSEPALRSPAEAKLRLSLHPIRRTARLSAVLGRPDGFPHRIILEIDGSPEIEAYDDQRYDDLDLDWTDELLDGELRITSTEGFHWLRSGRRVHIFSEDPSEPDLLSVGAARAGAAHTVICRFDDARAVRAAAESTRSPDLETCEGWQGIPDGWSVLSGYAPICSATVPLPPALRPLDPGSEVEIGFEDGLCIRNKAFAEGHPPRIFINPEPTGELVTIGGRPAKLAAGGGWEAPGWDTPGHHVVDVVPGPSATYEIVADPWKSSGWGFWNAHPGRFDGRASEPCAGTEVCGASIRGPEEQVVLAAETRPTLIALGMKNSAISLRPRSDIQVSVGLISEAPAFLLSSTGQRRTQGQVIWLGQAPNSLARSHADPDWVTAVRWATVRRLPLQDADPSGYDAWRKAKARARRLKKSRR